MFRNIDAGIDTHKSIMLRCLYVKRKHISTYQTGGTLYGKSMINKGVIFYENGTWSFVTKIVNCNTYTIEYEKNGILLC